MSGKEKKPRDVRKELHSAELSFDRAVEAATSDADLALIRERLAQFLKEISP